MKKVLLVNPPVFEVVEPYYDLPDIPRTALAFLAGYLRDNNKDVSVHVLDSKFEKLNFSETLGHIEKLAPDYIGITAMTNEICQAASLAKQYKDKNKNVLTIIGGVHDTSLPERTLREFPEFDYGIQGEGEITLSKLVQAFLSNDFKPLIRGLCYIENDRFINHGSSNLIKDQNEISPAWDLFKSAKEYMLQSSRGCPFACNFCMNPGGRLIRNGDVKTTLDEIGWLIENKGPSSIYFGDEIFTVKRDRAYAICEGIIERGYHKKISWWCQTHVNTLDENLIKIINPLWR